MAPTIWRSLSIHIPSSCLYTHRIHNENMGNFEDYQVIIKIGGWNIIYGERLLMKHKEDY